ncbi:LysR family transcriptional regulator [Kushneria phyllosphaerae]|uniref:HTH-type transcriptional regulator BenM n=1 Tax=Kushneria phyllosphaerae TaxID=2100822 RepID=A0A2R8CHL0_9GAMM|nr:LysR family transcriptional regulator [Kushneria phyllosphaerae]SPJ32395.1 HTH-type transcriptional regulator BenM [Kushneria phyllosphaerae]
MTDGPIRLNLRMLEQYVAVAEERHFHRAARSLNMSQPPLTHAIRKLEQTLDVVLIERGQRVLGLTTAGQTFLEEAKRTLEQATHAVSITRDMAAGRTGTVRLGYVGSALYGRLPDILSNFRHSFADIRLELHEATTAAQLAALREERLDVGILIPPLTDANDLDLSDFDQDRLCMALPAHHPLTKGGGPALEALADEPFILWPMREGRGFHLQVFRLCAHAGFVPTVVQEAYGMHAVLSLVAAGAGVSIVPESMQGFRSDRIRYYPIPGPQSVFALMLAIRKTTPAIATFLEAVRSD